MEILPSSVGNELDNVWLPDDQAHVINADPGQEIM